MGHFSTNPCPYQIEGCPEGIKSCYSQLLYTKAKKAPHSLKRPFRQEAESRVQALETGHVNGHRNCLWRSAFSEGGRGQQAGLDSTDLSSTRSKGLSHLLSSAPARHAFPQQSCRTGCNITFSLHTSYLWGKHAFLLRFSTGLFAVSLFVFTNRLKQVTGACKLHKSLKILLKMIFLLFPGPDEPGLVCCGSCHALRWFASSLLPQCQPLPTSQPP